MEKIYQCPRCGAEEFEIVLNEGRPHVAVCKQCLLQAPWAVTEVKDEL